MAVLLCLLFCPAATALESPPGRASQPAKVLLISSYHPGFPTFFRQVQGVRDSLEGRDVVLDVEFMDSKRFNTPQDREMFLRLLRGKLPRAGPYDVVITADDNALRLVLSCWDGLFQDTPVVFFGVNDRQLALAQNRNPWVTGVLEAVSMRETLLLMKRLQPDLREVVAISDTMPSGKADLRQYLSLGDGKLGIQLSYLSLADMTWEEAGRRLAALDRTQAVLLLSAYEDKSGRRVSFHEGLQWLSQATERPIYHLWHHGMKKGVLGGMIISHYEMGKAAGEMALRILDGASPADMPVVLKGVNRYYFNYKQLIRHGIDQDLLPPGSVVIDRPESFYQKYKVLVWAALILGLLGLTAIITLAFAFVMKRRAEQVHRESEHKFREMFDSITDLVYTQDINGKFTTVNRAMGKLLLMEPEQIVGRFTSEFMDPAYREGFWEEYLAPLLENGHMDGTSKYFDAQGGEHYVEYRSVLITPPTQEPFISGSGRDVTERVLTARKLRRLQHQLLQAQKMESIGTLAGGIAHDFNNILAAIVGYGELALESAEEGQPAVQELENLLGAAARAKELVRQILTFSRRSEVKFQPMDLNSQVAEAVEILRRTTPLMIDIGTSLDPRLRRIEGDSSQMEQVVMNLGCNARDAMPGGGSLRIETKNVELDEEYCQVHIGAKPGPHVMLVVADTGTGMSPELQKKMYDPFFTTKEVGKGTGLGLSSVFGIVRGHGGHMECYSEPGQGTVFKLYFPALSVEGSHDAEAQREASGASHGRETILLVDDEPSLRSVGSRMLASGGYKVITAASGEEALEIYKRKKGIDLVVLDLNMPGMGGQRCLAELKDLNASQKVLIASGYFEGFQPDAQDNGADGYIAKPFRKNELLSCVRGVLDQ